MVAQINAYRIPSHSDAFSVSPGSLLHFNMWGVFYCFVSCPSCTVLYIFVQYLGENVKGGGGLYSSTFIFLWSKQWESALLSCANLAIVNWLTEGGFYRMWYVGLAQYQNFRTNAQTFKLLMKIIWKETIWTAKWQESKRSDGINWHQQNHLRRASKQTLHY